MDNINNCNNNNNNRNGFHVNQRMVLPMKRLHDLPTPGWMEPADETGYCGHKCMVCFERLVSRDTKIGGLTCDHVICFQCFQQWYQRGLARRLNCPYCQTPYQLVQVDEITIDED